nr:uncharacterized protein LOC111118372 isoform X2 [Crassostrea virginica]XP_022313499.1 uncharacterized protein LOC111118372 isoform X2 [Crassostrea virginica]
MASKKNDEHGDNFGQENPAEGYDAYKYSTDNKSENHTEFQDFRNVRPFDDCENSLPRSEKFSSLSHYKPTVLGSIGNQNSKLHVNPTRGFLHQPNINTRYKWFRKQSTERELNVEESGNKRSLYHSSTDHPTLGYNQSKSYDRGFNDKSLVNCIYGQRKRNLTSHEFHPYKYNHSRRNSRSKTPVKERSRSVSKSLTGYRKSSERPHDRHCGSRSPSSSCSYISTDTDRYRSPCKRDSRDYPKKDNKCQNYSSSAIQTFSRKTDYRSEFSRQASKSPSHAQFQNLRESRSSLRCKQMRYHGRSRRSYHRSRSPSYTHSRNSSRNSRYSRNSWSRSSSRGSRFSSLSARGKSRYSSRDRSQSYSRGRSDRSRSYSRSRSRNRRDRSHSYSTSRSRGRRDRSRSYSRSRSRNRRDRSQSYSRSRSRGRRDRSRSYSKSRPKRRRDRSQSYSRSRSRSDSRNRNQYRSIQRDNSKERRSKNSPNRAASSKYESNKKYSSDSRSSRARTPSYSRSRQKSVKHLKGDSDSSFSSSSSRSRSQSSDGSKERTPVQRKKKSRSRSLRGSSARKPFQRHQRRDSASSLSSVSSEESSSSQSSSQSSDTSGPSTPSCRKRKSKIKSSAKWHSSQTHQNRESDSCLSSIPSAESTRRSPNSKRRRQKTPLQVERKSSPLKDINCFVRKGARAENFPDRMRKRNEAIVRSQFERFEEEKKDEMLASVNNLLGKLVGSVTEHTHCEPVNEPVISTQPSESVATRNKKCSDPETEYRTIQIKPKSPWKTPATIDTEDGSHCSANMQENLRILLTSNDVRNVVCEKEQLQVAESCNAKKRKHPPEDSNKENNQEHSSNVKKGKRDLSPLVNTNNTDQDTRVVIRKQAWTSSVKALDNLEKKSEKEDSHILFSQTNCDQGNLTSTQGNFGATKNSQSPQTITHSVNDKEIAAQVLVSEALIGEVTPDLKDSVDSQMTENQNVITDVDGNKTNVTQSAEMSICSEKEQSHPGILNSSHLMKPVESAHYEEDTPKEHDIQTVKDVTKEKNESIGESCVAQNKSDFSDLELTSFDEFTDSDQDSCKFSNKSDKINSEKDQSLGVTVSLSSDISNIMPDQEMDTPSFNVPKIPGDHTTLSEELSSVEAEKDRSNKSSEDRSHKSSQERSHKSSEPNVRRNVKTSTPIRNVSDNVSSKISMKNDNGDPVKKSLFATTQTETDCTDVKKKAHQEGKNLFKRRDATESVLKQTEQYGKQKQKQFSRDKDDSKSDGSSQNVGRDKMYKKCSSQVKNISGEKESIQKQSIGSSRATETDPSKFAVEKSSRENRMAKGTDGKKREKLTEISQNKPKENKMGLKLKEVSSNMQVHKKPQAKKDHPAAEKSKDQRKILHNSHGNKSSTGDESLPKLVLRKDKNRDVSTTSIESNDLENKVIQKKKNVQDKNIAENIRKQKTISSSKCSSKMSINAKEVRKEQTTIAENSKNVSIPGQATANTQKTVRRHSQKSPKIKLIEQEDLFMPVTPQKKSSSSSKKSNTHDKSKQHLLTKGHKIPSTLATSRKGPTIRPSKSISEDMTTEISRTPNKTTLDKSKSSDADSNAHEKSCSSEMEMDSEKSVDKDHSEVRGLQLTNNEEGIKKENGKEMDKESGMHISPLATRRRSRAVSTEQLKVLEKNEKVRNRMCLELKQAQNRGRKMSKSVKIHKIKHKFHTDILHENFPKKHKTRDGKGEKEVVTHTFVKSTKESTTRGFKAFTAERTNRIDIVAKNILQKVPERKEVHGSNSNKIPYGQDKTSSNTSSNSGIRSSSDTSGGMTDASLQEYRNLQEDLDLSSDDEKLSINEELESVGEKKEDLQEKTDQNQVEEKLVTVAQTTQDRKRDEMEELQDSHEQDGSQGELKTNHINQDRIPTEDHDSEPTKDGAVEKSLQNGKEAEVNVCTLKTSTNEKVSEESLEKNLCSFNPSNTSASPAKPSAVIPEGKGQLNVSTTKCDQNEPNTNDSAEKDATSTQTLDTTNTEILERNQSQEGTLSSCRPETPSVNINTVQAARKILPEENIPKQIVPVQEENHIEPRNANNSQEADASSDYGTDSNRGTPFSDLSDSFDKGENQNPVTSEKNCASPREMGQSERLRRNAMNLTGKQAHEYQLMDILSKLRQEDLEKFDSICFIHRKTFKGGVIRNPDDNITIGFLHPQRFRHPQLLCVRCNVCQKYFDPCDFLVHVDMKNVELNNTSCVLTEPEHAMPNMNQAEQNIWKQFIVLKDILLTAKFNFISLDYKKMDQRNQKYSPSSQLKETISNGLNATETSLSQCDLNNTSSVRTGSCVELDNRRSEHQKIAHSLASSGLSQQSCLFQQPPNLMTNTLMLSCNLIDHGWKSNDNSSQSLNEMASRVRRTRSLTDEHLEIHQNREKRSRHQSNTLGDQQAKTGTCFDESILISQNLLAIQQRMPGNIHQSNLTNTSYQRAMELRGTQFSRQSLIDQGPSYSMPMEINRTMHRFVPRTQPRPYPRASVQGQSSISGTPDNPRKESCMLQSNRQVASSYLRPITMDIVPQPMLDMMNQTPVPTAHQNMTSNSVHHSMISPAHQNNLFIGGRSAMSAAVLPNTMGNRGLSSVTADKNLPGSRVHSVIPPAHMNRFANIAPAAHKNMSSIHAPPAHVSSTHAPPPAYQAPIPPILSVQQNMSGYCVPSSHQIISTSSNITQNQDHYRQSNSSSLNCHAFKSSRQNQHSGMSRHQNQHQSNVQSCSAYQPSINRNMCTSQIEQTVIKKNVPTSQTIGESSKSQIEKPTCQIQAIPPTTNSDNSFCQNSSKTSLSHTDPNYVRKSTDTQNPTLQASKSTDEPKQFAVEISRGTEKETEGSGNNTLSGEQGTSPNLGTAIGVTQTISSPSETQKILETSCVKMVASFMWMCEEFKRNTAEVISAKQELQQWKEEVKKTLSEYHTTEALMTQKIQAVLAKLTE